MEHAPFALVLKHARTHAHISTRGLTWTSSGWTELLRAQNVPNRAELIGSETRFKGDCFFKLNLDNSKKI